MIICPDLKLYNYKRSLQNHSCIEKYQRVHKLTKYLITNMGCVTWLEEIPAHVTMLVFSLKCLIKVLHFKKTLLVVNYIID